MTATVGVDDKGRPVLVQVRERPRTNSLGTRWAYLRPIGVVSCASVLRERCRRHGAHVPVVGAWTDAVRPAISDAGAKTRPKKVGVICSES